MNDRQMPLGFVPGGLKVVYAHYDRSEPFSFAIFNGFESLRVLTYSVSIPMIVRMLNKFSDFECMFGFEGVLHDFGTILAFQKEITERLLVAVKGLDDERKRFILEKISSGEARFLVVKNAIAHSKIYLLEGRNGRRVVVGSANFSDRAFSGRQAETLLAFDDEMAWAHYTHEYETVKSQASSEISIPDFTREEVPLEDVPIVRESKKSESSVTLYVNTDTTTAEVPVIVRRVERLADQYNDVTKALVKQKAGRLEITPRTIGTVVQLVKSHRVKDEAIQEPIWLSVNLDTRKVQLSGKEISLNPEPEAVRADVQCWVEYFENFQKGFTGDVFKHQRDYFMFMSWFYLSPFVCDLRNNAIVSDKFIFDYPMFAILFGKSNSGKTSLIQTLMMSMFGEYSFVDKKYFTGLNLRGLRETKKRFPVVFDDVDRDRFTRNGADIVKDEMFMLQEYPPFVLSMNAETRSFSTEVIKRCLMLYTNASLPDNAPSTRKLHESVSGIRKGISSAMYCEYLRRVLERLSAEGLPPDMLRFSSEVLVSIFGQQYADRLPSWCATVSIAQYQSKKYERIQADLRKLYETNRDIWEIRRDEVIIDVPQTDASLKRDIPDWILRPGSRAGQLVLDRGALEEFMGVSFRRWWFEFWKRS